MSRGDELWSITVKILKTLYDEGAISEATGVMGVTLVKEMVKEAQARKVEGAKEEAVTNADVQQLMLWLESEELIDGGWTTGGANVWLSLEGFKEGHRLSEEDAGGQKPFYY